MAVLEGLIDGMVTGLGMWIMMTVLGVLSFAAIKKWAIKSIAKFWADIKKEGVRLDGITLESKFKTKTLKKKK